MTSWKTSEIARRLAERDNAEPPQGLLEKIKRDIPAELPALPIPETVPETGRPRPSRHRVWLMAASLAATIGAGILAVQVMQRVPQKKAWVETTQKQQPARDVSPASPPPVARGLTRVAPLPSAASPALGPAASADAVREKKTESLNKEKVQAAQAPEALPVSPAKPAAPPQERASAKAESQVAGGVAGGRRISTGATVSNEELEKIPAARDPWAVLQKTPEVKTDRINVGGNESGQQSAFNGPPTAAAPAPPPSRDAAEQPMLDERRPAAPSFGVGTAVRDLVGDLSSGDELLPAGAVRAEGAPVPSASGASGNKRVLRFVVQDAAAEVAFNPAVVSSSRLLGSAAPAGDHFAALYEVTLKPHAAKSETIATLRLPDTTRELKIADLAATWDAASPGLRLAALAAELAGVVQGAARAKDVDLDDLVRRARKVATDLAGSPREKDAADFLRLAEETARRPQPHEDR